MALVTDRQKCAHLLRRFGLGASEAELDYYLKDGFRGAIDRLLEYEKVDEGFLVDVDTLRGQNGQLPPQAIGIWWTARLLTTRRPLQEKMTLFWHDHFATSGTKVNQGGMMHVQNEIFRANATGKFDALLLEVSKDPAMLFWLDNQFNIKGKPNENFAREVMELFTLGIGHYSEKDIQEAARSFTGWSLRRVNRKVGEADRPSAEFFFRPFQHDGGSKTVLGKTGDLGGEDVIAHLCTLARTAEYITLKLWEWFAYPNPDQGLVRGLALKFAQSKLDIRELVKAMMLAPEFYSERAERAVYKNPVDFVVATMRQLGFGQVLGQMMNNPGSAQTPLARVGPAAAAYNVMKQMGMQLMFPPDVAGWDGGAAWVSTATMVERIGWADKIFGRGGRNALRYAAIRLFDEDPTPEGVAKKLISVFDAPIPASKMPLLVEAAKKAVPGSGVTAQNANSAGAAVSRLIFASPEFQFV